jgi:hypothetical protein
MASAKLLVDALGAADLLSVGERNFYLLLRRYPDLAKRARVVLGKRAVRYRVAVLAEFIESLGPSEALPEPERLIRGREARRERLTRTAKAAVR